MNPKALTEGRIRNQEIANDNTKTLKERVQALSNLFFLYQGDVSSQAKIVREIQDLTSFSSEVN